MNKIKKIVREYANEYFTDEMLMSGDETWDYAALSFIFAEIQNYGETRF